MKPIKDCFDFCNETIRKVLGTPKRELRDVPVGQCALPTPRDEEENEYDDFDIRRITFNLEGAF
jgi:hypothetical protein